MRLLIALLLTVLPLRAAQLNGAVRFNVGTSGTNTTSGAITVSARTNLLAGTLSATNSLTVGQAGEAGIITLNSTNSTYALSLSLDENGLLDLAYGTDDPIFAFTPDRELLLGSISELGMLYLAGNTNNAQVYGGGVTGVLTHFDLFADDDFIYLDLYDAANQLRVSIAPMGADSATVPAFLFDATEDWTTTNLVFRVRDDGGTPLFGIAGESGWTGAGTLVLTDDGTYKPVAALSSDIWTNNSGTLQPVTSGLRLAVFNPSLNMGIQAGTNATWLASSNIFNFGFNAGADETITNGSVGIFNIGINGGEHAVLNNADNVFNFGVDAGWTASVTTSFNLMNLGFSAGESTLSSISHDLYNFGANAGNDGNIQNSSYIFSIGHQATEGMTSSGSQDIYAFGGLQLASLTSTRNLVTIGQLAGNGITGAYTNVVLIGDTATIGATGQNRIVLGSGIDIADTNASMVGDLSANSVVSTQWVYVATSTPVATAGSTNTFTNKSFDAAGTGNTLTQIRSLKLQYPRRIDGAGCTYSNTNDYTATLFMVPRFSATGATNANWAQWAFRVPADLDTAVDLTASLTVQLAGADTALATYIVGMVSIANSSAGAGTPANYVTLTIPADGSGGSGDIESVNGVTLTGWRSNMTANQWLLVQLQRDGGDASAVAQDALELEIFYTSTQ